MFTQLEWSEIVSKGVAKVESMKAANTVASPSGCVFWTAANVQGYGVVTVKTSVGWRTFRITRLIAAAAGMVDMSDPKSMVCHRCDKPECINRDHFFRGTQADNLHDANEKGRMVVPNLQGVEHPHAKLSEDQVRAIRCASGSQRELGRRFGVSHFAIGQIKRGKQYRSVL